MHGIEPRPEREQQERYRGLVVAAVRRGHERPQDGVAPTPSPPGACRQSKSAAVSENRRELGRRSKPLEPSLEPKVVVDRISRAWSACQEARIGRLPLGRASCASSWPSGRRAPLDGIGEGRPRRQAARGGLGMLSSVQRRRSRGRSPRPESPRSTRARARSAGACGRPGRRRAACHSACSAIPSSKWWAWSSRGGPARQACLARGEGSWHRSAPLIRWSTPIGRPNWRWSDPPKGDQTEMGSSQSAQ